MTVFLFNLDSAEDNYYIVKTFTSKLVALLKGLKLLEKVREIISEVEKKKKF